MANPVPGIVIFGIAFIFICFMGISLDILRVEHEKSNVKDDAAKYCYEHNLEYISYVYYEGAEYANCVDTLGNTSKHFLYKSKRGN